MLEPWGEYFFLLGSAAIGLIGLLFVVVTLTAGTEEKRATRGARLYMTPTMFHFAVVFVICAAASAGQIADGLIAPAVVVCGLVGIVHTAPRALEIRASDAAEHWSDRWFYGVIPVLGYILVTCVGAALYFTNAWAVYALAASLMALLLLGIRNAWDLVTFIAPRSKPPESSKT